MLRSITVYGMYGVENQVTKIPFHDNLTILVGDNGSGKTTVLNLISYLCRRKFERLQTIPFSQVEFEFDQCTIVAKRSASCIIIYHNDYHNKITSVPKSPSQVPDALIKDIVSNLESGSFVLPDDPAIARDLFRYFAYVPYPYREDIPRRFRAYPTDSFEVPQDSLYFPTYRRLEVDMFDIIDQLAEMNADYYASRRARRMLEHGSLGQQPGVVVGYTNDDIDDIIRDRWARITDEEKRRLNKLIKDFTADLLDPQVGQSVSRPSEEELVDTQRSLLEGLQKAEVIEQGKESLVTAFIDSVRHACRVASETKGSAMDVSKMSALVLFPRVAKFTELYRQASQEIEALWMPINKLLNSLQAFLAKGVKIGDNGALEFKTASDALRFESLSAGEKQLVNMFVYIGLSSKPSTLIMIDEPELSLHVKWQRQLVETLLDLGQGRQLIISTHSPFVIGRFRDNVVSLGQVEE